MLYCAKGSASAILSAEDVREALREVFDSLGTRRRVLAIPPDITRLNSYAGPITRMCHEYFGACLTDIMPALGTHSPMTSDQIETMFPGVPKELFREHNWRRDVVSLGTIPEETVKRISGGNVSYPIEAQVNKLLLESSLDLILSIGQVVPHEVVGMANYTKNIFVGVGGADFINKSHFLGASYGMERIMGRSETPVREVFEYAREHFLKDIPILYILTVRAKDPSSSEMVTRGLFVGDDFECFRLASELSLEVNFIMVEKPIRKCIVYLDPEEFKSTWLGNKAVYRTRMALADGAQLIILAPGLKEFGEDKAIDSLIRKYGYKGTPHILECTFSNEDLRRNLSASAHLIHGSSEGRFDIVYCPGNNVASEEIEAVGYHYCPYDEMIERYPLDRMHDGWNITPGGEEIYYISNPALGLWAYPERFKD